jgi:hypothetical protein
MLVVTDKKVAIRKPHIVWKFQFDEIVSYICKMNAEKAIITTMPNEMNSLLVRIKRYFSPQSDVRNPGSHQWHD